MCDDIDEEAVTEADERLIVGFSLKMIIFQRNIGKNSPNSRENVKNMSTTMINLTRLLLPLALIQPMTIHWT